MIYYSDIECFMLWYAILCYSMVCYSVLSCALKHVLIYIWLSSSSGRGRSIDDQVLDLALVTNYSQSTFMWTVD